MKSDTGISHVADVERRTNDKETKIDIPMIIYLPQSPTMIMIIMITEIGLVKILSFLERGVVPCQQLWDMTPMEWRISDILTKEN